MDDLLGLIVLLYWRRHTIPAFAAPVLLYGAFYTLALFGSASIAYYNRLAGRFLLPLYIPFITLLLVAGRSMLEAARAPLPALGRTVMAGLVGTLAALTVLLLNISMPVIREFDAGAWYRRE